jgi:hypothetical protein
LLEKDTGKKWYIRCLMQGRIPGSGIDRNLELGEEILFACKVRITEIDFAVEPVRDELPFLGISTDPAPRFMELGV